MNPSTCRQHQDAVAEWACGACGKPLCRQCSPVAWQQTVFCPPCLAAQEQRLAHVDQRAHQRRRVVRVALTFGGALALILGLSSGIKGCRAWQRQDLQRRFAQPRPDAPDFLARDAQGNAVSLAALRGRVVLLDFWASWCGPCIGSLPDMRRLAHRFDPKTFVLLGINQDTDAAALQKVLERYQVDWTQIRDQLDEGGALAQRYQVRALPAMVLIDKSGKLFASGHWHAGTLEGVVKFLLDQPPPPADDAHASTQGRSEW